MLIRRLEQISTSSPAIISKPEDHEPKGMTPGCPMRAEMNFDVLNVLIRCSRYLRLPGLHGVTQWLRFRELKGRFKISTKCMICADCSDSAESGNYHSDTIDYYSGCFEGRYFVLSHDSMLSQRYQTSFPSWAEEKKIINITYMVFHSIRLKKRLAHWGIAGRIRFVGTRSSKHVDVGSGAKKPFSKVFRYIWYAIRWDCLGLLEWLLSAYASPRFSGSWVSGCDSWYIHSNSWASVSLQND